MEGKIYIYIFFFLFFTGNGPSPDSLIITLFISILLTDATCRVGENTDWFSLGSGKNSVVGLHYTWCGWHYYTWTLELWRENIHGII